MLAIEALDAIELQKGSHASREKGVCAMELAAWIAGEPHSDHPACVSPVLGAFLRNWNDSVDHEFRQRLKPYIPRVIGTAGDGKDEARAWMAVDWLVRVCAPAWLEPAKLKQHVMALRTAEVIRDSASCARVQPLLDAARKDSSAARAAARDAAWDAARDAAWAAAASAARSAAWDAAESAAWSTAWAAAASAAWAAAWSTAWDAAASAARSAAWDAAESAAWSTAWDAAASAAWAAAWSAARAAARDAASDAARAAARDALKPTVELLQTSAFELLDRMIAGGE